MVAPTPEDEDALAVVRGLSDVLRAASLPAPDAASSGRALQLARELAPLLPELAPGLLFTGAHDGCHRSGGGNHKPLPPSCTHCGTGGS